MPAQDFSLGSDVTLDIIDPLLGLQRFSIKTGFKHAPVYNDIKSKGLDGVPRFANVPDGHTLSFQFDRADPKLDAYFTQVEQNYFNGIPLSNVSITQTIKERDGSTSQFRFKGVALKLSSGGDWIGDSKVDYTVEGMASRRIQLA